MTLATTLMMKTAPALMGSIQILVRKFMWASTSTLRNEVLVGVCQVVRTSIGMMRGVLNPYAPKESLWAGHSHTWGGKPPCKASLTWVDDHRAPRSSAQTPSHPHHPAPHVLGR